MRNLHITNHSRCTECNIQDTIYNKTVYTINRLLLLFFFVDRSVNKFSQCILVGFCFFLLHICLSTFFFDYLFLIFFPCVWVFCFWFFLWFFFFYIFLFFKSIYNCWFCAEKKNRRPSASKQRRDRGHLCCQTEWERRKLRGRGTGGEERRRGQPGVAIRRAKSGATPFTLLAGISVHADALGVGDVPHLPTPLPKKEKKAAQSCRWMLNCGVVNSWLGWDRVGSSHLFI